MPSLPKPLLLSPLVLLLSGGPELARDLLPSTATDLLLPRPHAAHARVLALQLPTEPSVTSVVSVRQFHCQIATATPSLPVTAVSTVRFLRLLAWLMPSLFTMPLSSLRPLARLIAWPLA